MGCQPNVPPLAGPPRNILLKERIVFKAHGLSAQRPASGGTTPQYIIKRTNRIQT
jgi:hypothetical protein